MIISDLHLSAGYFFNGKVNNLEDFIYDQELVQFFQYYSTGEYKNQEVEVVINGDFIDFLAVPYVNFFDDKFWSAEASVEKLKLILDAHKEVFSELKKFISQDNKKITYIIGNHDAELQMNAVANVLYEYFDHHDSFKLLGFDQQEYRPFEGVVIKHGHSYDVPNDISLNDNFFVNKDGEEFFIPPWGSYYVSRVINRFKIERRHVASVRPIKKFIINGLIYDFYFTCRFILANVVYYFMVRFIYLFKTKKSIQAFFDLIKNELDLKVGKVTVEDFIQDHSRDQVIVTGHTHRPEFTQLSDSKVYINTGTWTKMYNLEFGMEGHGTTLTYAIVESISLGEIDKIESNLQAWKGLNDKPFIDFA